MIALTTTPPSVHKLRTLLLLGRVSNVPTVWSNCLAGWLLGGGGELRNFFLLCGAATALYVGGMYMNDACDAEFDSLYRQERPIPSGAIKLQSVWLLSVLWFSLGLGLLVPLGQTSILIGLILLSSILVYDLVHKIIAYAPVLMAACRFFLYLLAGSSSQDGIRGLTVWSALAMASYIVGLSYLARQESKSGPLRYWPLILLVVPIALAMVVDTGEEKKRAILLSIALLLWLLKCCRWTYFSGEEKNIGKTVSGLLAGIVLVDLIAVVPVPFPTGCIFLGLLLLALLFQRFIPAT